MHHLIKLTSTGLDQVHYSHFLQPMHSKYLICGLTSNYEQIRNQAQPCGSCLL
jgi:hypothetical protein